MEDFPQDVQGVIFEKWVRLLHKDIHKLNIRGIMEDWEKSQSLGVRGQVLRAVILEETPDMMQRLAEKYEYLLNVAGDGYEGLVRLWRLRKLAKAMLRKKEEKLRKLLRQAEYRDIYWLLGPDFALQIQSRKAYILYLYFYVLTSPRYNVDVNKLAFRFVNRRHSDLDSRRKERMANELVRDLEEKLKEVPKI